MAFPAEATYRAIMEVIEGRRGGRRVPVGSFRHDNLVGEPEEKQRSAAKRVNGHIYDLRLTSTRIDASSPVSSTSTHKRMRVTVEIDIWSHKDCDDESLDRIGFCAEVASACDDVNQALCWPDAFAEENAGTDTLVASGMIIGSGSDDGAMAWDTVSEDWVNHIVRSRLSGAFVVEVIQNDPQ